MEKSITCLKKNGEPLTEYSSKEEAEESALYIASTYENYLVPYQCNECNKWHLSPKDRQTPSTSCAECGKSAYETENIAEKRASIILKEGGKNLRVYKCPAGEGWHLTSNL